MGIIVNEGRYMRSTSLRDTAVRRKHPLNFMLKAVASHHIISCEATRRLSSFRRKQIIYKGYDVNHPWNLVMLPMQDRIACHYRLPLHKSGHKAPEIITHYEKSLQVSLSGMESELKNEAETETDNHKQKVFTDDANALDLLGGYHRITGVRLTRVLKGLTCKSEPKNFTDKIDDLSIKLLKEISTNKLLLLERGKHFAKGKKGCDDCQKPNAKTKRVHFDALDNAPTKEKVKTFCYLGIRLKTIQEQK